MSPGVYNHGMSVGFPKAFVVVSPELCRGQHVISVLNGPSPKQRVPVILARGQGESGGHGEGLCPLVSQFLVEARKTQVEADRKAKVSQSS